MPTPGPPRPRPPDDRGCKRSICAAESDNVNAKVNYLTLAYTVSESGAEAERLQPH